MASEIPLSLETFVYREHACRVFDPVLDTATIDMRSSHVVLRHGYPAF